MGDPVRSEQSFTLEFTAFLKRRGQDQAPLQTIVPRPTGVMPGMCRTALAPLSEPSVSGSCFWLAISRPLPWWACTHCDPAVGGGGGHHRGRGRE